MSGLLHTYNRVRLLFGLLLAGSALAVSSGWVLAQTGSALFRHVAEADLIQHHCLRAQAESARLDSLVRVLDEQLDPVVTEARQLGVGLTAPDLTEAQATAVALSKEICSASDLAESASAVSDWQQFAAGLATEMAAVGQGWPAVWAERQRELASQQTDQLLGQLRGPVTQWQKEINDYAALESGRATDLMAEELADHGLRGQAARDFLQLRRERAELEVQGKVNLFAEERQQAWHAAAREIFPALEYPERVPMTALGQQINALPNRIAASWQMSAAGRNQAERAAADSMYRLAMQAVDGEMADSLAALSGNGGDAAVAWRAALQQARDRFETDLRLATDSRNWQQAGQVLDRFAADWRGWRREIEQLVFSPERLCQQLSAQSVAWQSQLESDVEAIDELMIACQDSRVKRCWPVVTASRHLNEGQRQLAAIQDALVQLGGQCREPAAGSGPAATALQNQLNRILAAQAAIDRVNQLMAWELELRGDSPVSDYGRLCRQELRRIDTARARADAVRAQWESDYRECQAAAEGTAEAGGRQPDGPGCQKLLGRHTDARNTISRMEASAERRAELADYCQKPFANLEGVEIRLVRYWDDFDKWDAVSRELLYAYQDPDSVVGTCQLVGSILDARTRQIAQTFHALREHRASHEELRQACAADGLQAGCMASRKAEEGYDKTEGKLQEFLDAYWGMDRLCRRFADGTKLRELLNFSNVARSAGQRAWSMSLSTDRLYDKIDEAVR